MSNAKTLGHTASDFGEFSDQDLEELSLAPGRKGFGVPALFKGAYAYLDGLRPGDIIISIDGKSFESTKDLNNYIRTKAESDIVIEYLRNGRIRNLETKLCDEKEVQECRRVEELWKEVDFGDPYSLVRAHWLLRKTHWDFLGLDNLQRAQDMARANRRLLLVGLFGSPVCCVHLALWTAPYNDLITHPSVQKIISGDYVSVLIVKPEAYGLYREHQIDSRLPALLRMTWKGQPEAHLSFRRDTYVSDIVRFLQREPPSKQGISFCR